MSLIAPPHLVRPRLKRSDESQFCTVGRIFGVGYLDNTLVRVERDARQISRGMPEGMSDVCASAPVDIRAITSSTTRMISIPTVDSWCIVPPGHRSFFSSSIAGSLSTSDFGMYATLLDRSRSVFGSVDTYLLRRRGVPSSMLRALASSSVCRSASCLPGWSVSGAQPFSVTAFRCL
jgi:hypothetical protein